MSPITPSPTLNKQADIIWAGKLAALSAVRVIPDALVICLVLLVKRSVRKLEFVGELHKFYPFES
jgi:hypothetical protein